LPLLSAAVLRHRLFCFALARFVSLCLALPRFASLWLALLVLVKGSLALLNTLGLGAAVSKRVPRMLKGTQNFAMSRAAERWGTRAAEN